VQSQTLITLAAGISLIHWQNEYVVYNQVSGDTHLLDEISGGLILHISEQTISRELLLKKLSGWFDSFTNDQLNTYLDDFIVRFKALDLLEIAKNCE
jgi:PqqD family protein of HPr-rel-A system